MRIYILDTDHLSLYGRNHLALLQRLFAESVQLNTTVINVEEQLRGRLAQVAEAEDGTTKSNAYIRLVETVTLLSEFTILQYSAKSHEIYKDLIAQNIPVGSQDLRIASITLANKAILLTKNLQEFNKVPGLNIEDWSI
ncbi:MAG: type II toxin-antitoxin system VapC family toxin [Calothrix sp. C42_A2020_038]|nr:type II toxin-antitoxin system VapC family toxin [Calothrix sp. C42_A2020_038]